MRTNSCAFLSATTAVGSTRKSCAPGGTDTGACRVCASEQVELVRPLKFGAVQRAELRLNCQSLAMLPSRITLRRAGCDGSRDCVAEKKSTTSKSEETDQSNERTCTHSRLLCRRSSITARGNQRCH